MMKWLVAALLVAGLPAHAFAQSGTPNDTFPPVIDEPMEAAHRACIDNIDVGPKARNLHCSTYTTVRGFQTVCQANAWKLPEFASCATTEPQWRAAHPQRAIAVFTDDARRACAGHATANAAGDAQGGADQGGKCTWEMVIPPDFAGLGPAPQVPNKPLAIGPKP